MKRKILPFLLLIFSICLISSGCFLGFIDNFKLDRNIALRIQKQITTSYNSITKEMSNLHASMIEMNDFFALYYKDIDTKKDYYKEKLKEIEENVDEINNDIDKTNNICNKTVDKNSKDKCISLNKNKDTINNNYEKLKNTYNEFIDNHDKWLLALAN